MNYFYLSQVMQQWQKEGIINRERKDKSYDISLTEKGIKIVGCLKKLKQAIEV